jgi:hypothetical protein
VSKNLHEPSTQTEISNQGYRIRQLERRPASGSSGGLPFASVFADEFVLTVDTDTCTPCALSPGQLFTNDADVFPGVTSDLLELPVIGMYQVVVWISINSDPTIPQGLHQVTYFPSSTLHYGPAISNIFTSSGQFDGTLTPSYNPQVIWQAYYVGVDTAGVAGIGVTHFWTNETEDPDVQRGLDVFRVGDFPTIETVI